METTSLHVLGDGADTAPAVRRDEDAAGLPATGDVLLGKYAIERVLGAGGMGVVLAARHLALDERVAIKLLRPEAARREEAVIRFLREARALARLKNEHVARVMDVGTLPSGAPYMVMELLSGNDLAEEIANRGALPIPEAVGYVRQACRAMAEAHALGIVHRDLKPANLFLHRPAEGEPVVKVIDFGIAKTADGLVSGDVALTAGTVVLGSPAYMSPEQVRAAGEVDARSDVWALGVILHELCTGKPPFEAATPAALLAAVAADPPARLGERLPGAPIELERLLLRCLEKDVERRIASATALEASLSRFAGDAGGQVLSVAPAPPPRRREPRVAAAVAGVGLAAISALFLRAASGPTEGAAGARAADGASITEPAGASTASILQRPTGTGAAAPPEASPLATSTPLPPTATLPATADRPMTGTQPATATLPASATQPATTSLPATGTQPATAALSATATLPATTTLPATPAGAGPQRASTAARRAPPRAEAAAPSPEPPGGDIEAATARRK